MRIFVGALSYELKEDELKAAFETYGKVESATIIVDRDSGRSKGFGFVEMPEKEEALKAIEGLNGTDLGGKTITVNEARPKSKGKRPGGYVGQRSGYGGGRGGGPGGGPGGGKKRGDFGGSRRDRPGGGRGNR